MDPTKQTKGQSAGDAAPGLTSDEAGAHLRFPVSPSSWLCRDSRQRMRWEGRDLAKGAWDACRDCKIATSSLSFHRRHRRPTIGEGGMDAPLVLAGRGISATA